METKKQFIKNFYDSFECKKRNNGEEFLIRNTDNELLNELFMHMHKTDMLPDDYRYDFICSILGGILDYDINYSNTLYEAMQDYSHELIDGLVPVYNNDRLKWLSSNLLRASYIDDAQIEGLISNECQTFERIGTGIFYEIQELYNNIISALDAYFLDNDITE